MNYSIIASSPSLELSGANVLVANLLDEFCALGLRVEWLVTGHHPAGDAAWLGSRRFPIHNLPPTRLSDIRQRQTSLLEFLEARKPCVYLPNFDFDMGCAVPALSPLSKAALIMHCDDPVYYDFASRYGERFNAIICVSEFLATKLRGEFPKLSTRVVHIPFGVKPPLELPVRSTNPTRPLQVVYCGRISFHQKRVQDLAAIINQCHEDNLQIEFQIAGAGPDEEEFFKLIKLPLGCGRVNRLGFRSNREVLDLLERSDVLLMTSEFEGLPVVLLEAMSRGCAPVVTQTKSGMSEVVRDGVSGVMLPVGDVTGFVAALARLAVNPENLSRLRRAAFDRIQSGGFTLERAAGDYRKLFDAIMQEESKWPASRNGQPVVPPHYRMHQRITRKIKRLVGVD